MELVDIGGGFQLAPPAAAAWNRSVAAGCPTTITSAYRPAALQATMRSNYLVQLTAWYRNPVGRKPTYVAAVEDSEHVTGNALDLKEPAIVWQRAHPEFGYVFTDSSERWHVAYRFMSDRMLTLTPAPPAPPAEQEDEMAAQPLAFITTTGTPTWWVTDGMKKRILAPGEPQQLVDIGLVPAGPDGHPVVKWLPNATVDSIPNA